MGSFVSPQPGRKDFHCPRCGVYAHQTWVDVSGRFGTTDQPLPYSASYCSHCMEPSLWAAGRLLDPDAPGVPPPNEDLGDDVRADYLEAASVLGRSPRSAASLLRLAVQKLMVQLGQPGRNLDDDIASLVRDKGLPTRIQQALDVVRVVGNNAVHPGQMDLRDDRVTASRLFDLINLIADSMLTEPRRVDEMFQSLPEAAREAIVRRDNKAE